MEQKQEHEAQAAEVARLRAALCVLRESLGNEKIQRGRTMCTVDWFVNNVLAGEINPNGRGRIETGVLRFRDDWSGIFIRGDDALHYAMWLEELQKELATIGRRNIFVEELQVLLASCREGP